MGSQLDNDVARLATLSAACAGMTSSIGAAWECSKRNNAHTINPQIDGVRLITPD